MTFKQTFFLLLSTFLLNAKEPLLFYCGVTMVPPMKKIAKRYAQIYDRNITIIQGGSGEIYQTLTLNHNGDLYLPGNPRYITETHVPGLFPYQQNIGSMCLTLFTRPGNPFKIEGLHDLLRRDLRIGIGSPGIGSIGKTTQKMLKRFDGIPFVRSVGLNALYFAVDSRDLNQLFLSGKIDTGITWKPALQALIRSGDVSLVPLGSAKQKTPLRIAVVRYAQHPDAAKAFIELIQSNTGQAILQEAGFDF